MVFLVDFESSSFADLTPNFKSRILDIKQLQLGCYSFALKDVRVEAAFYVFFFFERILLHYELIAGWTKTRNKTLNISLVLSAARKW